MYAAILSCIMLSCKSQPGKEEIQQTDASGTNTKTKTGEGQDLRYLVTKSSFGLISLTATYENIISTYGKERVTDEKVMRAPDSDEMVIKTIINKGKSDEISVQWHDNAFHKKIISIDASQNNHPFKTTDGVHYGTTIAELVAINGAKISFTGFGWDFGGLLNDFHGGKLAYKEGQSNISYEININTTQPYDEILGDQVLVTDMPITKKFLDYIFIYKISLSPAF